MVIASSSAVYGDSPHIPLTEKEILKPLSPYAVSKQVTEVYAGLYTRTLGLPVVALRYFNVYGPRQSIDSAYAAVIPIFIRRLLDNKEPIIYGDGRQIRDFIYVEDVVRANILAAQAPQAPGYAFNICSGQETNLLDLLKAMKPVLTAHEGNLPAPRFAAPRMGDIYRSVGDPTLAQKNLEFRAQISLEEGLTCTAASI